MGGGRPKPNESYFVAADGSWQILDTYSDVRTKIHRQIHPVGTFLAVLL